jgi:hypothetical protein
VVREDREHAVETHRPERLLLQLGHVLDEYGAFEVPTRGLEQVIEGPVAGRDHGPDVVVDLRGEVEPFGNDDLGPVDVVELANFGGHFVDHAAHGLVVVEAFAGLGVDHLAGLELAAGNDTCGIDAEDPGLAGDVEPAALVGTPAHRAETHAIDGADEDAAVGGNEARGTVPGAQAAVVPAAVTEEVNRFLAPELGLRVPDRRDA